MLPDVAPLGDVVHAIRRHRATAAQRRRRPPCHGPQTGAPTCEQTFDSASQVAPLGQAAHLPVRQTPDGQSTSSLQVAEA